MKHSLLVTGAGGFVGRHLLARLRPERFEQVTCLGRSLDRDVVPASLRQAPNVGAIVGADLGEEGAAEIALRKARPDTVVHLAAATGRASAETHVRDNAEATERLVRACEATGVRRFIFVSSIAAKFQDVADYPYARAKQRAEAAVRASRLRHLIVRPTIVLGHDAPIWHRLSGMAAAPVTMLVGPGTARVQPIFVDDLADCLLAAAAADTLPNETVELGGGDVVTMEELLRRIRRRRGGEARVVHLPYAPIAWTLGVLERMFGDRVPVTAGQLSSFVQDGVAEPSAARASLCPAARTVDEMLPLVMGR